jgi:hypothetical protein
MTHGNLSYIKYKVLQIPIGDDSVVQIPRGTIFLGVIALAEVVPAPPTLPDMGTAAPPPPTSVIRNYLAFMMKYEDWEREFPEDARHEVKDVK